MRSSAATSPPSRACGRRPGAPCGCCASRSPILRPCESASPTLASSRRCRRRRGLPGAGSFPGPMWRTSCSAMLWGRRAGAIASRTLAQRRSPKRKLRTTRKGRPSNSARRRSTREPSCISSVMVPATRRIEGERSAWALSEPLLILSCQGLELEDMQKTPKQAQQAASPELLLDSEPVRLRRAAKRAELASECSLQLRPLFSGEPWAHDVSTCQRSTYSSLGPSLAIMCARPMQLFTKPTCFLQLV